MQFCASFAHAATVDELAHVFPTAVHTEALHEHVAEPALPVQL
jgi:hypothetical protein